MPRRTLTTEKFRQHIASLQERHRKGRGGIRTALQLTLIHDTLLQTAFHALSPVHRNALAVIALGGYGRRELCFGSDIDIMLLVRDTSEEAAAAAEAYFHRLLDFGLNIGHSVRTVDDCLAIAAEDMESRLSMLESRLISGPAVLFAAFRHAFDAFTRDSDPQDFVRRLFDLLRQRHDKYGSSSTLLEPNIKNSAGGLRDLHTAYWVLRGTGFLPPLSARSQKETATTFFIASPGYPACPQERLRFSAPRPQRNASALRNAQRSHGVRIATGNRERTPHPSCRPSKQGRTIHARILHCLAECLVRCFPHSVMGGRPVDAT
jgi:UTP:GlnB (protein PII) uridylyltransferase